MPSTPNFPNPAAADIAQKWLHLGQDWARWWAEFAGTASTRPTRGGVPSTRVDIATKAGLANSDALGALNEKYRQRWEALWAAAAASLASNGTALRLPAVVEADPGDRRFAAREWSELPYFALVKQGYLLAGEYLQELALLPHLTEADRRRLAFATRQFVDALAPTNFVATNPEVLKRALSTEGASLRKGLANLAEDTRKGRISMSDASAFEIGRNLAVTPGSVVFRNELIELIQYAPTTARVHRRPLLVVPPCINKYYVLDLQPENSLARWTVGEGYTVFMISWRNVGPDLGSLSWDAYIEDGVLAAIRVAAAIAESKTINTLGFCVGGTLLACALAVLATRGDRSVESATLLTTMLDFADPGDIGVYVSADALAAREPAFMAGQRLRGSELAGAFASLRANDLVWHYVVNNYLKGETPPAFDLLYWNGDSANLPGPMYVYYLRNMYIDNKLREPGALTMDGVPIDLSRVTVPTYVLATKDDHIVPWRSAYATTRLVRGDITFVLGASGHIAGVVNPPGKNRRNYWTNGALGDNPDDWLQHAESHAGSWWPHWARWLGRQGGARRVAPRSAGSSAYPPLYPAPGRYVSEASG